MDMELGLYLGDAPVRTPKQPFFLADNSHKNADVELGLGFCMGDGLVERRDDCGGGGDEQEEEEEEEDEEELEDERRGSASSGHPINSLQHLIPFSHVTRKSSLKPPWHTRNSGINMDGCSRGGFDVNMIPSMDETDQEGGSAAAGTCSSPNSGGVSSFQVDLSMYRTGAGVNEAPERASSRASDEEENNGSTRKKLRLSKEQSAYLEESFKEHNTPNPKQKLALADKLNLRPRQVEVWFQNRRARTKLKQTEVDCEYLKKCCERLTEENRRLQKELQELRALKSAHPYYMHVPATTLTMCPSCERIASATTTHTAANNKADTGLEMNPDGHKTDSPWTSFLNPFWHQQKTPTATTSITTTTTTTRQQNSATS